jgi:hypothetical protein
MRKTGTCINCREVEKIAAHGLCYSCYRRDERAEDNKFAIRDRHNPGISRDHKKIFRALAGVMAGLSDLGVGTADVLAIRQLLEPYVAPIAKFLGAAAELEQGEPPVNSERSVEKFAVHTSTSSIRGRERGEDPGSDAT